MWHTSILFARTAAVFILVLSLHLPSVSSRYAPGPAVFPLRLKAADDGLDEPWNKLDVVMNLSLSGGSAKKWYDTVRARIHGLYSLPRRTRPSGARSPRLMRSWGKSSWRRRRWMAIQYFALLASQKPLLYMHCFLRNRLTSR